jgi:hypothetical protein
VAATSGVLVAFQSTEYATKVALLSGLVVVCGARPLIERIAPAVDGDRPGRWVRARVRRPAALVAVGAAVLALVLVGSWSAAQVAPAVPEDSGRRPEIELRPDQRPAVELGAAVARLGAAFDEATAQRIATEVVENLLLADRAVERADRGLAASVAVGEFLDDVTQRTSEPVPARTFSAAVVDVVRTSDDFQAVPRLAVTLTGTVDGSPWSATFHVSTGGGSRIEREVPTQ